MDTPLDNPMHTKRIDDERNYEQEYQEELDQADQDYDTMIEDQMLERD